MAGRASARRRGSSEESSLALDSSQDVSLHPRAKPVPSVDPISMPVLARARWATRAEFIVLGVFVGTWSAHVPTVKAQYALSEGMLSLVLFAAAAGTVLSLLVAGRIAGRISTRGARGAHDERRYCLGAALPRRAAVVGDGRLRRRDEPLRRGRHHRGHSAREPPASGVDEQPARDVQRRRDEPRGARRLPPGSCGCAEHSALRDLRWHGTRGARRGR